MKNKLPSVLCGLLFAAMAPAQEPIGALRAVERSVLITNSNGSFRQAHLRQGVFESQSIRTLRRSRAAIGFIDRFELRINERTELVLHRSSDMRRANLNNGGVWVRLKPGEKLEIETPTLTAAVRGTEFELTHDGELRVYEGTVEVTFKDGSKVMVHAREMLRIGAKSPVPIPRNEWPADLGGPTQRWWETIRIGVENLTWVDSNLNDLRDDPLRLVARDPGGPFGSFGDQFSGRNTENPMGPMVGALFLQAWELMNQKPSTAFAGSFDIRTGDRSVRGATVDYHVGTMGNHLNGALEFGQTGTGSKGWADPDSLLYSSRFINSSTNLLVGRMPAYESLTLGNHLQSALNHGRMSGARMEWNRNNWHASAAWYADVDPNSAVRTSATVGSVSYDLGVARIGLIGQKAEGGGATSYGVNTDLALIPGWIDVYGEYATDDQTHLRRVTLGGYSSWLRANLGVDLFGEYQEVQGINKSWSLRTRMPIGQQSNLNVFFTSGAGDADHFGVGLQVRF